MHPWWAGPDYLLRVTLECKTNHARSPHHPSRLKPCPRFVTETASYDAASDIIRPGLHDGCKSCLLQVFWPYQAGFSKISVGSKPRDGPFGAATHPLAHMGVPEGLDTGDEVTVLGRGLHSSTFRLNLSRF